MTTRIILIACVAILLSTGLALGDWQEYKDLYVQGQYQQVVDRCASSLSAIEADPGRHIILKYCGMAKLRLYEKDNSATNLTDSINYLERAVAYGYSEEAAFNLGQARLKALDLLSEDQQRLELEKKALNDLWTALHNLHAQENFSRETVSDTMLVWSKDARDDLIDRVFKNENNKPRLRLLTAYLRMLSDRFALINPQKGENETRQANLKVFKDWMLSLMKLTYFDNNIVVGMYKYKADRYRENYNQKEETDDQFTKALAFYGEALKRAKNNKARAVIYSDVAFLCSLYNSENKDKLIAFYKTGFTHAYEGVQIMKRLTKERPEDQKVAFLYEPDSAELTGKLQKSYGADLTGLTYFYFLRKDYENVVGLSRYAFDAGFDWDEKRSMLMIFAESADNLASQNYTNHVAFNKYKEICLSASSRAFKLSLKGYGGKIPPKSDDFCQMYTRYVNYLRRFGEAIESRNLTLQYGAVCGE